MGPPVSAPAPSWKGQAGGENPRLFVATAGWIKRYSIELGDESAYLGQEASLAVTHLSSMDALPGGLTAW